ncbi:hypothetical protein Sj15T_10070 [Sphingobium sp. TA15]|uniref:Uncharacterized protein n=1 Tax=Sphingobium indicum (strain DSM 16413 / CCM 7287 / MTCC 6362 / UT26 / NBRC 101211 / UT26S) TaxID=452662 RepID=D4Z8S8_SPHIU|nr:hypothetical protein [Sphingobium indicum]BAI99010.1 hypothetical protein SJA_P1-00580 [Sphingobium indicum UT26S]BDD65986.1 hypothetical protein Sj15T_10070 [Sphingobium sp. TA15]
MQLQVQPAADLRALLDRNPVIGEPRRGPRRFWTTREEKLLGEHYPAGGVEACLLHLPGRTATAIYNHAATLGLQAPSTQKHDFRRQRWTSSDHIDAVIRRAYQRTPAKGDIDALAVAVGRPRWWVTKRASKLGLVTPRFKEPAWTDAERDVVHDNFHRSAKTIQRMLKRLGFVRTETAITVMGKRMGATREDPHHVTAHGLATLMGVDAKTVSGWIARGLLKARRRGTERTAAQGGDQHWIHLRDVRGFIIDNAAVVDIRKVDKFWFIDLLAHSHN